MSQHADLFHCYLCGESSSKGEFTQKHEFEEIEYGKDELIFVCSVCLSKERMDYENWW